MSSQSIWIKKVDNGFLIERTKGGVTEARLVAGDVELTAALVKEQLEIIQPPKEA